jgi:hypothetical protein
MLCDECFEDASGLPADGPPAAGQPAQACQVCGRGGCLQDVALADASCCPACCVPEHDVCPLVPGCPCCFATMRENDLRLLRKVGNMGGDML